MEPKGNDFYVYLVDAQLNILATNQVVLDLAAQAGKHEIIGKNLIAVFPVLGKLGQAEYTQVLQTGKTLLTRETTTSDGELYVTETQKIPLLGIDGSVTSILTIVQNVTRQEQKAESLKANKAKLAENELIFSSFLEHSPVQVFFKDKDIRAIALSRNFEQMLGKPIEDLIGKSMFDLFPNELARSMVEDDKSILRNGKPVTVVEEHDQRTYETTKFPIFKDGSPNMLAGFTMDITERVELEKQMLMNQKLESLGVLAGGIAHDFNNLLGGIFGNLDLARHRAANCDVKLEKYLNRAMDAFDRARHLTHQLLTFSKGGAPSKTNIRLDQIIEESANLALSGSQVRWKKELSKNLWSVEADVNQIRQVFNNLLLNSRHAMPDDGIIVVQADNCILCKKEVPTLAPGNFVRVSITDSGCGIDEEIVPRVFDPFFSTKTMGSGLGLATCHSIITQHGGTILIESNLGKGTTVSFYLKASEFHQTEQVSNAQDENHHYRVLLLEDEELVAEITTEMLHVLGGEVVLVLDGDQALQAYGDAATTNKPFDFVIFDLTIPGGMGGEEAMKKLKLSFPDAVGIVSSGYADSPVMSRPADYGFAAKLEKPFRKKDLDAVIKDVVKVLKS